MSSSVINVIQDGAAILQSGAPNNVQHLFTTGLQSCVAIMAKGSHGVILVHDTGKLKEESLVKLFKQIGEIQFWTTAFYPNADREYAALNRAAYQQMYGEKGIYPTKYSRIERIMREVIGPNFEQKHQTPEGCNYYRAEETVASISRSGAIYTTKESAPFSEQDMVVQPGWGLRASICQLNNACMQEEETLDCHLQYDGNQLTNLPQLIHEIKAIENMAEKDSTIRMALEMYENAKKCFEQYKSELQEIINIYTSPNEEIVSLDNALRRAAAQGKVEHIRFLIEEAGADIDAQGPKTGKTALHQAAENGHKKAIQLLLQLGAKKDILDLQGNAPNLQS